MPETKTAVQKDILNVFAELTETNDNLRQIIKRVLTYSANMSGPYKLPAGLVHDLKIATKE